MPDEFVTKTDCSKTMDPLKSDLATVLRALVGDDLRGGLVKDVADIKASLRSQGCAQKAKWGKKEYALVATAVISASASVIVAVIAALAH